MIKKKYHPKFNVPNFGAKHRKKVPERWRKQRGIDNKKREQLKGYGARPRIGYKNSESIRFARPDGKKEVLVHNEKELLTLIQMENHVARFAADVSRKKRMILQKIADKERIRIVNRVSQNGS